MLALLRLHALQLRTLLGLWGLAVLCAVGLFSWGTGHPEWNFPLACGFQLLLAPLGLIAALRVDLVAWLVPVTRSRRLASQWIFTIAMSVLGALGTMALLREYGDTAALVPRLAALSLSGLISTLVLGAIYLVIEDDETIVGWVAFLVVGAIDIGWTCWELKQPYPPAALGVLGVFALLATGFYTLIFMKSECEGPRPATGFVPAPPKFPDNPDEFVPPRSQAPVPELVWPGRPVSREAGELLGISSDLRKGRSFAAIMFRKNLGTFGFLVVYGIAMFLFPAGVWIQNFLITSCLQMGQSLKTWAYFAHTPWSRRRAFAIAISPWLSLWVALALATLIHSPFSGASRFLAEDNLRFSVSPELALDPHRFENRATPELRSQFPQETNHMAAILVDLLKEGYGIETTPQVLLSFYPKPFNASHTGELDVLQGPWLKTVQEKFQASMRWSLIRRRLYDCLMALALTFLTMLCWMKQNRASLAGALVSLGALFGLVERSTHRVFLGLCDAIPLLSITIFVGLCAALLFQCYRAFREWTPVNRKAPLHLKFR